MLKRFMKRLAAAAVVVALVTAPLSAAKATTYTFSYFTWPAWMTDTTNYAQAYVGGLLQLGSATGVPAHVSTAQTTAPALTSCGTTPAISGTDTSGTVTMGTSATGCVITFNVAYNAAPRCNVTWRATPLASQSYTISASALTLTQTSTSNNLADYTCMAPAGG